ncbi:SPFH/Band 7/PHB domain protein [Candidatus Micrarchaeota archaeon]|nr:SPFH/Band 7/PHB domain protein [Candidatus Micrarchaeota archaeon]
MVSLFFLLVGLLIIAVVALLFLLKVVVIVRPTDKAVVERLGRFHKVFDQGFHLIIPFVDVVRYVNITERMMNAESQEVITKDNLNAKVDAQIYFKVRTDDESVKKSLYNVQNYSVQIVALARTTLRDIIGNLSLKEANSMRGKLNNMLASELNGQTVNWGIEVVRAELKEVEPPGDVQETMNKVVKAENEKLAAIDFATARETEADGVKRAKIKEAEGIAKAIELKAMAEAGAIKAVSDSSEKYFTERARLQKQLEVLETVLRDNTKFVIPGNSSVLNVLGLDPQTILPVDIPKPQSKNKA